MMWTGLLTASVAVLVVAVSALYLHAKRWRSACDEMALQLAHAHQTADGAALDAREHQRAARDARDEADATVLLLATLRQEQAVAARRAEAETRRRDAEAVEQEEEAERAALMAEQQRLQDAEDAKRQAEEQQRHHAELLAQWVKQDTADRQAFDTYLSGVLQGVWQELGLNPDTYARTADVTRTGKLNDLLHGMADALAGTHPVRTVEDVIRLWRD